MKRRRILRHLTDNHGRRQPMSPALAAHVDTLGRGTCPDAEFDRAKAGA
ncbi:MAG: hypothetical protein AAGA17_00335 [Actinomycetota bacterium]